MITSVYKVQTGSSFEKLINNSFNNIIIRTPYLTKIYLFGCDQG